MAKTKSKFDDVSDEELRHELIGREADRRAAINKANQENAKLVIEHVDLLLQLVPKHDTINCSDENTASAYLDHGQARCRRCCLLRMKEEGYNDNIGLDIQLVELKQLDNTPGNLQVVVQDRQ